jgi:subtilase family serine protease
VPRKRGFVGIFAAVTLMAGTTAGLSAPAGAASGPAYQPLAGSAAPFTSHRQATGAVAGSTRLTIQVWLRSRDLAAAQRYATAVSTPGRALFHHYLSPDAYTARFGASPASASAVQSWLRGRGFTGVSTDAQRSYVRATGTAAVIDAALRTQLEYYRSTPQVNAGPHRLRASSRAVSLPRSLAGAVLGVTGLDNAAPQHPLLHAPLSTAGPKFDDACSHYYGQHYVAISPRHFGRKSLPTPVCGYSAAQLRAAYGASMRNAGRGQTVALVEFGLVPDMFLTLQDYARAQHFTAPSAHRYTELSLGKNTCGDFDVEEQLDVESAYVMAPAANQLVVGGDSCDNGDYGDQGLFDADLAVINGIGADHHPLASISSNSWGPGDDSQPPILTSIMHAYLVRAAAQGAGMYFASGDSSGVETPDDPFVISVGGTSLGINQHGQRRFEAGWSTGFSLHKHGKWVLKYSAGAASGGPSRIWGQPAYQRGVVPKALATAPGQPGRVRSQPDVAADADLFTGAAIGLLRFPKNKPPKYFQDLVGGTSMAAPLVAGIVADAQQGQHQPFGFTDPALYRLSGTAALHDVVPSTSRTRAIFRGMACCADSQLLTFDDQSPRLPGYTGQVTLKGYDNMTGVGTPRGQYFLRALRKLER